MVPIQKLVWILKGFVLGTASLVPGVSAGTLALIMNIYEKIIFSITNLTSFSLSRINIRKSIIFLMYLMIGGLLAILILTRGIVWLLSNHPLEIYCVFTGLIAASLPKLIALTDKKKSSFLLITLTAIGFFALLKILPNFSNLNHPSLSLFFMSGFFSFFASILPGLSGSAVLLILGTYHPVLNALSELMIKQLIFFLTGGALGLSCSLYGIRLFLKTRKNLFFCVTTGFIIGSLPEILPWDHWHSTHFVPTAISTIVFICIGVILFFLIEKKS